jgi:hypothetical protein
MSGTGYTWTDMPAALTEFEGATRTRQHVDLSGYLKARLVVNVVTAGAANAKLRIQYSTDLTNWYYLDGVSEPSVNIGTAVIQTSSWINLVDAAKTDVYLRIVGLDGDGTTDPRFASIILQVK